MGTPLQFSVKEVEQRAFMYFNGKQSKIKRNKESVVFSSIPQQQLPTEDCGWYLSRKICSNIF